MRLVRHENYNDYTKEEINTIKKHVCVAHNCPYIKKLQQQVRSDSSAVNNIYCDYISMTGHSRGCLPVDCKHYDDKGIKRRKFVESTQYGNYEGE